MNEFMQRITVDDEICNGKPTIRGLRITVQTIMEFMLAGTSDTEILTQYPVLEQDDLAACRMFAINLMGNHYSLKSLIK